MQNRRHIYYMGDTLWWNNYVALHSYALSDLFKKYSTNTFIFVTIRPFGRQSMRKINDLERTVLYHGSKGWFERLTQRPKCNAKRWIGRPSCPLALPSSQIRKLYAAAMCKASQTSYLPIPPKLTKEWSQLPALQANINHADRKLVHARTLSN